jgi:hypothetical protein
MASLPDDVLEANVTLAYKCVRDIDAMTDYELATAIHCAGHMSAVADMNLAALMAARDARAGVEAGDADREAEQDAQTVQVAVAVQAALVDKARRERKRVTDAAYRARKRARKLADAGGPPSAAEEAVPVERKQAKTGSDGKRKIVLNVAD